jgi:hypothetical protein
VVRGPSSAFPISAFQYAPAPNHRLLLLSGKVIAATAKNPSAIVDVFNREAAHAMKLKSLEL